MELYEADGSALERITRKADAMRIPIGGTMELLPLCNMQCKMCFVQDNSKDAQKSILGADEWISIARKAKEAGVLYILLTGGEPLFHPDFKKIYLAMREMGLILTVNSNGTLLDEEWADFFERYPCRRYNITLYGASNETYARLCGNPRGFDQTIRSLHLLKKKRLPVRVSITLTKENKNDLKEILEIVNELNLPCLTASYMFPPIRRKTESNEFAQVRMTPKEAAETRIQSIFMKHPDLDIKQQAKDLIDRLTGPIALPSYAKGFSCRAARSGFWISWKGRMMPCGMIESPSGDLLNEDFMEIWQRMIREVDQIMPCQKCRTCRKKIICQSCAAACFTENGRFDEEPNYLCDMTDEIIRSLLSTLGEEDKRVYADKIKRFFPKLI